MIAWSLSIRESFSLGLIGFSGVGEDSVMKYTLYRLMIYKRVIRDSRGGRGAPKFEGHHNNSFRACGRRIFARNEMARFHHDFLAEAQPR